MTERYRAITIQKRVGPRFSPVVRPALQISNAAVVLPEYFYFQSDETDLIRAVESGKRILRRLCLVSKKRSSLIIAGSVIDRETVGNRCVYRNRSYVFFHGKLCGFHTKFRLFGNERPILAPGDGPRIIETPIGSVSVLICADVLDDHVFERIREMADGRRLLGIFCPTTSPYKQEDDSIRRMRDRDIYLRGARICDAPVFKACAVGSIRGHRVQGRSLAAFPNGVIVNAPDINTEYILDCSVPYVKRRR